MWTFTVSTFSAGIAIDGGPVRGSRWILPSGDAEGCEDGVLADLCSGLRERGVMAAQASRCAGHGYRLPISRHSLRPASAAGAYIIGAVNDPRQPAQMGSRADRINQDQPPFQSPAAYGTRENPSPTKPATQIALDHAVATQDRSRPVNTGAASPWRVRRSGTRMRHRSRWAGCEADQRPGQAAPRRLAIEKRPPARYRNGHRHKRRRREHRWRHVAGCTSPAAGEDPSGADRRRCRVFEHDGGACFAG